MIREFKKGLHSFEGLWSGLRSFAYCELNEETEKVESGDLIRFNEYDSFGDRFTGRHVICCVHEIDPIGSMILFQIQVIAWVFPVIQEELAQWGLVSNRSD